MFLCPPGMIGTPLKGRVIANFVFPLGMIGNSHEGQGYRQFVCSPLGMIGNAHEGRSHRQVCVPSRYDWERR